jgi:predicted DCC family thiol-disulfide oxidoreductase YuxK
MKWSSQRTLAMPTTPRPARLQIFFDGACPLCSREVRHYKKRDPHHAIEWIDIAQPTFNAPSFGLDPARVNEVMHARSPDGTVSTEVAAFVKIWEALPPAFFTTLLRYLLKIPGMMAIANFIYRRWAKNRYKLTGRCTPESCELPPDKSDSMDNIKSAHSHS